MKISIIVYSEWGNTLTAADYISRGALEIADTKIKCFNIKDEESWDKDFITQSKAVIFGTPTYYANMCWQMKKWFDTCGKLYSLGGKLGSAFATENSPNGGGAELAIMTIYNHLLVYGMLVYSSGVDYGRPPIHIGPTVVKDQMLDRQENLKLFGRRIATKAHELWDSTQ